VMEGMEELYKLQNAVWEEVPTRVGWCIEPWGLQVGKSEVLPLS
jgi:hypothetical protein